MFVTASDMQQRRAPHPVSQSPEPCLACPFTECPSPPPAPLLSSPPGPGSSSNPHQIAPPSSSTLPQRQALGHPPSPPPLTPPLLLLLLLVSCLGRNRRRCRADMAACCHYLLALCRSLHSQHLPCRGAVVALDVWTGCKNVTI